MTTFGMLLLTLFTVAGGAILGWLARRFLLDDWDHERGSSTERSSRRDGMAIGTVAAGTAAMGLAAGHEGDDRGNDTENDGGSDSDPVKTSNPVTTPDSGDKTISGAGAKAESAGAGHRAAAFSAAGSNQSTTTSPDAQKSHAVETAKSTPSKPGADLGQGSDGAQDGKGPDQRAQTTDAKTSAGRSGAGGTAADSAPTDGGGSNGSADTAKPTVSAKLASGTAAETGSASQSIRSDDPSGSDNKATSAPSDAPDAAGRDGSADAVATVAATDTGNSADLTGPESRASTSASTTDPKPAGGTGDPSATRDDTSVSAKSSAASASADAGASGTSSGPDSRAATAGGLTDPKREDASGAKRGDGADSSESGAASAATNDTSAKDRGDGASSSSTAGATNETSGKAATLAELDASRAEARQLRTRLGEAADAEGLAGDESQSLEARLAASRADSRDLRQKLWSQSNDDADSAENKASQEGGTPGDAPKDLSADEAEAARMLSAGGVFSAPAGTLDAPSPGRPQHDLTKINGVGKPTQDRLNRHGIYYYDQIADFKATDIAWADRELSMEGRVVSDRWVPQARALADAGDDNTGRAPVSSATDGSDAKPASAAPSNLLDKPIEGRDPDDLTLIKGIGPKIRTQLNDKGIYYFDQIAGFSETDQAWADETLGFPGRVGRDEWVPQARDLAAGRGGVGAVKSTPPGAEASGGRSARLNVLANAGRELGSLSADDEPGEMSSDETEAMRLIDSGEFVADETNKPKSLLTSASNGEQDDLKRIKGVGPKLEDILNNLGVYYFNQVATFSATDIAWVDSKLKFRGRIVRDRWVDQAKRLS